MAQILNFPMFPNRLVSWDKFKDYPKSEGYDIYGDLLPMATREEVLQTMLDD